VGRLTAVDLFSGAGGISLGLEMAGYDVLLANDWDPASAATFRRNFPGVAMVEGDIREIGASQLMGQAGLRPGDLDLLIGGPPCQGFSIIGARVVHDSRNDLFRDFLRIGAALRPKCLLIENVPGMATLAKGAPFQEILQGYGQLGYTVSCAELLAAQYGVPQMRWRMVIIGFRKDLGIPAGVGFPRPTHGHLNIGDLIPNCTISPKEAAGFVTTWEAIGDLPPVQAGQEVPAYQGPPACAYQREMRRGLTDELYNHYAPRLSRQNLARIAALKAGQDWRDLPRELLPPGMQRAKRKDHTRRYSRMTWDGIPRSIITRFRDPKSGEYTHPEQHRTISIREAARIQSFPDRFAFAGSYTEQYEQVGNAVPPKLAEAIAREVGACLRAEATHQLGNPFRRRPSFSQPSLPLHVG
jgi:DNA (cytosine-5)-methyltransferase 1